MQQIALRYGAWMFLGFAAFFLSMHLLQWSHNYYLRIFNGVIHAAGLWLALRAWMNENPEQRHDDYPTGVAMGLMTTLVAVVPFTIFMAIFLAYNPGFMAAIQSQTPIGQYFNPVTASVFILMEGVAAGVIGSYIIQRVQEAVKIPV